MLNTPKRPMGLAKPQMVRPSLLKTSRLRPALHSLGQRPR
jgi:hypothetical protein